MIATRAQKRREPTELLESEAEHIPVENLENQKENGMENDDQRQTLTRMLTI